jgi:hypothetical protein
VAPGPSFPASPLPPRWRTRERGKTQAGWWNARKGRARPQGIRARSRWREGKRSHGAPGLGARAGLAMWSAPNGRHLACRVTGRGKRGLSPNGTPWSGSRVRARARRACQLGGPAVPSVCTAAAHRVRCGAALGKKAKKKKGERPTRGSHTSARERKRRGVSAGWAAWFGRPAGLVGLEGSLSKRAGPC